MEFLQNVWSELLGLVKQGGFALWAVLAIGVLLYGMLFGVGLKLGVVKGEVLSQGLKDDEMDRRSVVRKYAVYELETVAWIERRMPLIGVLVGACTLGGLLGTVSGMLATFSGLASEAVVDPVERISGGISEAMLTTQAGLLFAIPAAVVFAIQSGKLKEIRDLLDAQMHGELVRCEMGVKV